MNECATTISLNLTQVKFRTHTHTFLINAFFSVNFLGVHCRNLFRNSRPPSYAELCSCSLSALSTICAQRAAIAQKSWGHLECVIKNIWAHNEREKGGQPAETGGFLTNHVLVKLLLNIQLCAASTAARGGRMECFLSGCWLGNVSPAIRKSSMHQRQKTALLLGMLWTFASFEFLCRIWSFELPGWLSEFHTTGLEKFP